MKRHLLVAALSLSGWVLAATADDASLLAGKWSVTKVNAEGQQYTQTLEVKPGRFVFQILGAQGATVLYAEGDLKLEPLGPFSTARFWHLRGGASADNLEAVDDEYLSIYTLNEDTWTMAVNFDKVRDQAPTLDVYHRVKAPAGRTLVLDALEMRNTPQGGAWFLCLDAKVNGVSRRYHLDNQAYETNQVTIPLALELPGVQAGQKCAFTLQLDDTDADVCTEEVDNRSSGEFTISDLGSQAYKPEDNWSYSLRWHLKP